MGIGDNNVRTEDAGDIFELLEGLWWIQQPQSGMWI